ncbi:MAG TPA: S-methyl-5'-thioadenosine phosphorylase [Thermomicrobiales bacterium]|nr:S-methyl-5'-thioadenosine phosphorylase [Thermomicrobiales bacterium]
MLGVIGGTGLYDLPNLEHVSELTIETPFGYPSSPLVKGTIAGNEVVFIARHGRGHHITPSQIPFRANIYALKHFGVSHVLSVNAVGSLREHLPPGTAIVPDQIIDRTVLRERTFFDRGIVAHVGLADPFCESFRQAILSHANAAGGQTHDGGTYVCIEGPQFSTRAESNLYRQWGADIIGMTAMPEARLAREAGLCYGSLAMVTDYDVWHDAEEDVSLEVVQRTLERNADLGRRVIQILVEAGLPVCEQDCANAAAKAIATQTEHITDEIQDRLSVLLGHNDH